VTKPKSLRMKLLEFNRPPACLQAYPAEEMDAYLYELESEIPELRNNYAGMIAERDVLRGEKRKLQAENARLREALQKIDDEWEAYDRGYTDYAQGYDDALDMVSDIARVALKGGSDE
jgi:predicted nuclease with TOPRIM domain